MAPERSAPFSGVLWQDKGAPRVQINGKQTWYLLLEIDGIDAVKIADYARKTYQERANKRFTEDLAEQVIKPGFKKSLKKHVRLKLKNLVTNKVVEFPQVEMTKENRNRLRNANQASGTERAFNPKFEPHTFRVKATYVNKEHIMIEMTVLETNDPGEKKWEKVIAMPKIVIANGQRGTVKLSGARQIITIDTAKPILNDYVVAMLTIEKDGKLMMAEAKDTFHVLPWTMVAPGVAVALTVLAFNLIGDGVQDHLNVKLNK